MHASLKNATDPGAVNCEHRTLRLEHALNHAILAAHHVVGFERMNDRVNPFFVMRSRLLKHARATGQRLIAVTSVEPGDGKTHVALNLATALGRIHPTVLLELDLRFPSVASRLGLPRIELGVDDYLAGDADWRDVAIKIAGSELTVFPVRAMRGNAEDLLVSPRLSRLLDELRSADGAPVCLIDTPPALVNDDLLLIARAVDGVLLVVREARTRASALLDTINTLSPTPIVGSILNGSISGIRREIDYGAYATRAELAQPG